MEERNVAVIILLNKDNEVILQKKDLGFRTWPGYWCFFGGGIREGEKPEETIKREIRAETGLELDNLELYAKLLRIKNLRRVKWCLNMGMIHFSSCRFWKVSLKL